ncbi:MAG: AgmX/PglI C-terminal domain-containing protein [Polyangiaceae bacterium]|nr:AgmX/PglI C-terminal domain-containing protein [Polyangiaceae bacterium]
MRLCVVATLLGLLLCGCGVSSAQPQPPAASVTVSAEPQSTASPADTAPSAAPTSAPAEPPKAEITNEPPPGGTVVANAAPVPSGSDRMQPMFDLIKQNRDGFRKCFDLWGKKNPGQAGNVAFQFFLKADGSLEKAQMKRDEGDVHAAEVENCMINFAKALVYPKSAVGKDTVYTHRFEFKASK